MRYLVVIGVLLFLGCFIPTDWIKAEDTGLLSIENKYIKVFINNSPEETGRFAVDVTKGDPQRDDDDDKPLIYGHPLPWTSFTTIRVDGQDYVFGKATGKRPGAGLPGGEIVEPPRINDNRLVMKCKYNSVVVEQSLDIVRSPNTGTMDTARIKYHLQNQGTTPVEVGLRALLDTMVGSNDGAPFRMGNQEVTGENSFNGNQIPDYWQAFDSLAQPAVIAQGTLRGGEITPPDRIVFTNWGKAADHPWDFPVEPGNDFLRTDEDEMDSAVAMYWEPRQLNPDSISEIVIYFGLGGITFAPGKTFLGITAPAEVQHTKDRSRTYTVIMYLEHHGDEKAKDIQINLNLPEGLECISGSTSIKLPELLPEVTKQFSWEIVPNGLYWGDTSFQIKVTGENLEANQVARRIKIIGLPVITGHVLIPPLNVLNNKWDPSPMNISVTVKNIGESEAHNVKATIVNSSGLQLVEGESKEKFIADIGAKKESGATWKMMPVNGFKKGKLTVMVSGVGVTSIRITGEVTIPRLATQLTFAGPKKIIRKHPFSVELFAYNLTDVCKFISNIKYDPKQLQLVYVSRGIFSVENQELLPWSQGVIDHQTGTVRYITCSRKIPYTGETVTLLRLNFIAVGSGEGQIKMEEFAMFDSNSSELPYSLYNFDYRIEEE